MKGTGDDCDRTETSPSRHRRAGIAKGELSRHAGEPSRPRFADDLRNDFRLVFLSILVPGACALGGLQLAVFDGQASAVQRAGGSAMVLGALLVLASYALRFTMVLERDGWAKSRVRRSARLVLRHSWHAYVALCGAIAVYVIVDWLSHRWT